MTINIHWPYQQLVPPVRSRDVSERQQRKSLLEFTGNHRLTEEMELKLRDDANKKFLKGLVPPEELVSISVPEYLNDQAPPIQAHNKGLEKIYTRNITFRRSYLKLMVLEKQNSREGKYHLDTMKRCEADAKSLQSVVERSGGIAFVPPAVLGKKLRLLKQ